MTSELVINDLQREIDSKIADIKAESYQMSIGELISLYQGASNDGTPELDLHPEFQRFFQWKPMQKTKLIESILLGIPLPPIFVAQREDGVWDVIDGTQRLSTIFQFMGILRNEDNKLEKPLILEGTKYLPSLRNKVWHNPESEQDSLTNAQKLYIKRAKLDVKIIMRGSDKNAKYEMFNRLNTGGTKASEQDVRNCILVMENPSAYNNLKKLSEYQSFKDCIMLTEQDLIERYDLELVLRFLIFRGMSIENVNKIKVTDLSNFLTDGMLEIIKSDSINYWDHQRWEEEGEIFKRLFDKIGYLFGDNAFRKYDFNKKRNIGGFTIYAFEVVALGLGYNISEIDTLDITQIVSIFWKKEKEYQTIWRGKSANSRIPQTIELGRKLFSI